MVTGFFKLVVALLGISVISPTFFLLRPYRFRQIDTQNATISSLNLHCFIRYILNNHTPDDTAIYRWTTSIIFANASPPNIDKITILNIQLNFRIYFLQ